ncbi:hypothetical protein DEU56DRAFT_799289 [Suillus clintonianus]|uniref:uncharacterized protein n=1 Tax=Suillus clintonianus TaxID=1904413 RepID=UPI001B8823EE|nr:uncharacterized protein DEU56DRAFT_799289 [Suillus clintonianus]KAG2140196.1 hypothetical protein DEU56DRAFT_799289 [Suillus clintonianus]
MATDEDTRKTINRLLLVNALTEGALEEMMVNPEYFDEDNEEFLGDFNCTDALGNTALHLAVRQGHPADVAALCGGAVDLDLHNKNGDTPLYIALKEIDDAEARLEIVAELLSCGAESKQTMPGGLTPLEYAKSRFPSEKNLHEIIANPPGDEEEDELQPEQLRKQMYDSSDFADDDEDEGEGSTPETD